MTTATGSVAAVRGGSASGVMHYCGDDPLEALSHGGSPAAPGNRPLSVLTAASSLDYGSASRHRGDEAGEKGERDTARRGCAVRSRRRGSPVRRPRCRRGRGAARYGPRTQEQVDAKRTGAPAHSNSICSYSGLNDMIPGQGPIDFHVQSPGQDVATVAPRTPGHGTCAGRSNPRIRRASSRNDEFGPGLSLPGPNSSPRSVQACGET